MDVNREESEEKKNEEPRRMWVASPTYVFLYSIYVLDNSKLVSLHGFIIYVYDHGLGY